MNNEQMIEEIERLQAENNSLRAELLKAPNAQMVAFIAAFDLVLGSGRDALSGTQQYFISWQQEVAIDGYVDTLQNKWHELKSEHLTESTEQQSGQLSIFGDK